MINHTLVSQSAMPKTQQGQVVHGGKNFERAARKEAAKKQRKADKEAEYDIYLKAEEMVKSLQAKLRDAGVPFKTATNLSVTG